MFELNESQKDIQDIVRQYAQEKVKPLAEEIDREGRYPAENINGLTEMGIMGINIPEAYGGAGMDELTKCLVIIELAKVCASTAVIVDVHYLVSDIIMSMGTEAQKAKYLSMAAEGKLGAFCLTEPGAGSDAGGLKTKAVKDGDDFILNGAKCFISNCGPHEGNHFVVIALTDPEKKTHGGMTAFLIDRDNPGLSIGKTEDKMGIRGSEVSELILTDCRVPADAILGKIGDGFKIAMIGLDGGRIGIASQAVGIAEGALEAGVKYAKEREQFGKPIAAKQGLQWYIADMATRLEAAKLLVYEAADLRERGEDVTTVAAMAKLYAGEAACYITDLALQIHGGYGYMKDYAIERMYRDARITRIYEGTSEVQKMVISRNIINKY
jgi:Acyl-CoA dehydrogenases